MYLPIDSNSQNNTQEFTVNIPPIELSRVPWECAVESVVYNTGWKTRPLVIHLWLSLMFNDNVVDSRCHKIAYTFVPVVSTLIPTHYLSDKPQGLIWYPLEQGVTRIQSVRIQVLDGNYNQVEYEHGKTSVKLLLRPIKASAVSSTASVEV